MWENYLETILKIYFILYRGSKKITCWDIDLAHCYFLEQSNTMPFFKGLIKGGMWLIFYFPNVNLSSYKIN